MAQPSNLAKLSLADLDRELRSRQRTLSTLERRRATLLERLAELDAEIAANGGSAARRGGGAGRAGGGRTRPKNESPLLDALRNVLKGKTMSVTDVAEAVQSAGYQTTSPNFRTIVNQTLLKKKHFKRVGRGMYTAT